MSTPLFESVEAPASVSSETVSVAVPAPLPEALWYTVPEHLSGLLRPGQRVRVPLGRQRRIGVVMPAEGKPSTELRLRELEDLLDLEPVLDQSLLALARWMAEYYLAPIGEVVDSMLPAKLAPTARARVSLTSAGALTPDLAPQERLLTDLLLERGRPTVLELFSAAEPDLSESSSPESHRFDRSTDRSAGLDRFLTVLHRMVGRSQVRIERRASGGGRFVAAVELAPGTFDELLDRCGRSPKARRVVEILFDRGHAEEVQTLANQVECGPGVIRRLVKEGVLRQFTQARSLDLKRHLSATGATQDIVLRDDQRTAADEIVSSLDDGKFAPFLLRGMTGSGKTEVYLRAVARTLELGGSSLILVPEIALVPALAQVLRERFGRAVAILHSNLSAAERTQEWRRIRRGDAKVVVGPRSAALAPLVDLRLVVVDEEHDGAYKQDAKAPRYSGRDVALKRAHDCGATAVIASATPSMEALGRVEQGRYGLLVLTERAGGAQLPEGELVDLRREPVAHRSGDVHFSEVLDRRIRETAAAGRQIILLRNRRGFAPVVLCRACGFDYRCDECGLPRTLHWKQRSMVCHYCDSRLAVPSVCGDCGAAALEPVGAGTERVEQIFRERYPELTVDVLDRDASSRVGGAARILERFGAGETQVLIGTQMISKGHHFPNVALTGVLSADTYLKFPDFRAVERTFALLTQVVGRSGRGTIPGRFVLQTFHPDHYAIRAVMEHDPASYEESELEFRRQFGYPPFARVASVLVRDRDQNRARALAAELGRVVEHKRGPHVRVNGPAPAPLERLRGAWRFQLLLRSSNAGELRRVLEAIDSAAHGGRVVIDVDPQNLL